jgi:hypothetical protein
VNWTGVRARLLPDARSQGVGIKTSARRHADEVLEEARRVANAEAGVQLPSSAPWPCPLTVGDQALNLAMVGSIPPRVT